MFFFKDTATTEIYTLSLHDALPIFSAAPVPPEASPPLGSHRRQRPHWQPPQDPFHRREGLSPAPIPREPSLPLGSHRRQRPHWQLPQNPFHRREGLSPPPLPRDACPFLQIGKDHGSN